jgi:hypothetical protein
VNLRPGFSHFVEVLTASNAAAMTAHGFLSKLHVVASACRDSDLRVAEGRHGRGVELAHYSKLWREFLEDAKDAGIAILVVAVLFGLGVGIALIFHYI